MDLFNFIPQNWKPNARRMSGVWQFVCGVAAAMPAGKVTQSALLA